MKKFLILSLMLVGALTASAQKTVTVECSADEVVRLWDNTTAKHSNEMEKDELIKSGFKVYNTSSTDLYIFTAPKEKATGYAMVIFPGGGYRYLSFPKTFPEWCRDNGITAVVVKYRLPNIGHSEATLEDAIGAIEYMRANAEKYNIDPDKIGVYGNSAGGHLAGWVSNAMEDGKKPCYSILVYGAMARNVYYNSYSSNSQLKGKYVTSKQIEELHTPSMVGPTTPPALLLLSHDDTTVPSFSSTAYYRALKQYGIPASMHIYPSGGHGWSGRLKWEYRQQWLGAVKDWIMRLEEIKASRK
ncbi:MAG: alpha/beta hydrolase [Alistipes sp.]|nr:alpha/beta hydrolase [Alistipes sp.]